jgi:hypothetical protein
MTELQESLRIKDKERYQLEQELARSTARREALELQISDKEEVKTSFSRHFRCSILSNPHLSLFVGRLSRSRRP